jgi:hypothetical protein
MLFPTGVLGLGVTSARGRLRRLAGAGACILGSASLLACGGSNNNTKTDTVAPEIQQVAATLGPQGTLGSLDLDSADDQRVISSPTPLNLEVEATDDVTPGDALKVQALDANDDPIADQTPTFHNGLWNVVTTAKPGLTVRVAVSDQAGNRTLWPYAAVFPTQEQALVSTWTLLVYGSGNTVLSRPHMTLTATTWCQEDDAAGDGPSGGTWSIQSDGRLQLQTRGHTPCSQNPGNDGNSVLSSRTAAFYVDATFFSDRPYTRESGSATSDADLKGSWTRTADIATTGTPSSVTSTLTLVSDNTFQQTTEDGHQISGTYTQEQNTDYTTDFGNLLVLTTTQEDGAAVSPAITAVHYWTILNGELLIDPFVEIQ